MESKNFINDFSFFLFVFLRSSLTNLAYESLKNKKVLIKQLDSSYNMKI